MIEGLARPGALALALLALPIILLYMLRPRRPRTVVSSTFLWRAAQDSVASTKPWQRLKPSVLLILQLLALLGLVFAAADPFGKTRGISGDHLVLIVDTSGSMLARDGNGSRLESAVSRAQDLASTFNPGGVISVVDAGTTPAIALSSSLSRSAARSALKRLRATEGSSRFSEAFILAESLETPQSRASLVVLSDGGLTLQEQSLIPPGTVFEKIGDPEEDVALALHAGESAGGFQALVSIDNNTTRSQSVEVFLDLNNLPVQSALLRAAPSAVVEKTFNLGATTGNLTARFERSDALRENNHAQVVLDRGRPTRILLMTPGNVFLKALLSQMPGATVDVTSKVSDGRGYDLAVYDRVDAPSAVKVPAIFVAPTKMPDGVKLLGEVATPHIGFIANNDPLLADVDLSEVAIARAQAVSIQGGHTLVGAKDIPLLATWSDGALRRIWFGFDLHESNLALQVGFPILGDHLLGWLAGTRQANIYAGEPIEIPTYPGADKVQLARPDGSKVELIPGAALSGTGSSGFYTLTFLADGKEVSKTSAAVSFPPRESNLNPRDLAAIERAQGRGVISDARKALWPLLAALVLALLVFEWWWAHGRPLPVHGVS